MECLIAGKISSAYHLTNIIDPVGGGIGAAQGSTQILHFAAVPQEPVVPNVIRRGIADGLAPAIHPVGPTVVASAECSKIDHSSGKPEKRILGGNSKIAGSGVGVRDAAHHPKI